VDLNAEKIEEAKEYLNLDKQALQNLAAEAGVTFTFDDNGNISNYEEIMKALEQYDNNYWEQANADGNWTEIEETRYERIGEVIDKIKTGAATYDETRELLEDLLNDEEELKN